MKGETFVDLGPQRRSVLAREALARQAQHHTRAVRRSGQLLWTMLTALGSAGRGVLTHAEQAGRLRAALEEILASHKVSLAVEGLWPREPAILVANHVSYLDPIIIGACHEVSPVAKAEVHDWPIIGAVAARLGAVFVSRGDVLSGAMALRRAQAKLAAGVCVLAFPEGTTSVGASVLPFRLGAFGLAVLADVPVVPVTLQYASPELIWTGDATFLPHYLKAASRRSISAVLRIGAPLRPQVPPGAKSLLASRRRLATRQLAMETRAAMLELLRREPRAAPSSSSAACASGPLPLAS
ncbi:MAG: lysophospholipid acyltransferase family protein [Kofleriaceae bacterium]